MLRSLAYFSAQVSLPQSTAVALLLRAAQELTACFIHAFPSSLPRPPQEYEAQNNVFANLMVISTSLAIGLVLGFSIVSFVEAVATRCSCCGEAHRKNHGRNALVPW